MERDEPTECVSCGQCDSVNRVPFGLERFQCFKCGANVAISRQPTAACAAASTTALQYEWLQFSPSTQGAQASTRRSDEGSGYGFLGKLQKHVDKTMQKVEKAFSVGPPPNFQETAALQPRDARPAAAAQASKSATLDVDSEEDAQMQWALSASLAESSQTQTDAAKSGPVPCGANDAMDVSAAAPAAAPIGGNGSDDAPPELLRKLRKAERRALQAEEQVVEAREREAAADAYRNALQAQLLENERLCADLASRLDVANVAREEQKARCASLKHALAVANAGPTVSDLTKAEAGTGHDANSEGTTAAPLHRPAEPASSVSGSLCLDSQVMSVGDRPSEVSCDAAASPSPQRRAVEQEQQQQERSDRRPPPEAAVSSSS